MQTKDLANRIQIALEKLEKMPKSDMKSSSTILEINETNEAIIKLQLIAPSISKFEKYTKIAQTFIAYIGIAAFIFSIYIFLEEDSARKEDSKSRKINSIYASWETLNRKGAGEFGKSSALQFLSDAGEDLSSLDLSCEVISGNLTKFTDPKGNCRGNPKLFNIDLSGPKVKSHKENSYSSIFITEGKKRIGIDLSGAIIRQINFSNLSFYPAIFNNIKIYGTDYRNIEASDVEFRNSFIGGTLFDNSFIPFSYFQNSDLHFVSFNNSDLRSADFSNTRLSYVSFNEANLRDVDFSKTEFDLVTIENANLSNVNFSGSIDVSEQDCQNSSILQDTGNFEVSMNFHGSCFSVINSWAWIDQPPIYTKDDKDPKSVSIARELESIDWCLRPDILFDRDIKPQTCLSPLIYPTGSLW